jgi:hypothetical protein
VRATTCRGHSLGVQRVADPLERVAGGPHRPDPAGELVGNGRRPAGAATGRLSLSSRPANKTSRRPFGGPGEDLDGKTAGFFVCVQRRIERDKSDPLGAELPREAREIVEGVGEPVEARDGDAVGPAIPTGPDRGAETGAPERSP